MAVKKKIEVEVFLPRGVITGIDAIVARGLLGDTREEVVIHMIREYLFLQDMARPRAP